VAETRRGTVALTSHAAANGERRRAAWSPRPRWSPRGLVAARRAERQRPRSLGGRSGRTG